MSAGIIIISAPSGAGKNSFVARAIEEFPVLCDTITYTTRSVRKGESEGDPYHFVSVEKFEQLMEEDYFVEWARVHRNLYGTPHHQLEDAWKKGQVVIMDVDIQGARTFKEKFPQAQSIFIMPPSIEELKKRILGRDGQLPDDFELRMENAQIEINSASEFSHLVTNDEFEPSYQEFKKIIAEILKTQ